MTAIRTTRYVLKALTAIRDTRSQAGTQRLDGRDDAGASGRYQPGRARARRQEQSNDDDSVRHDVRTTARCAGPGDRQVDGRAGRPPGDDLMAAATQDEAAALDGGGFVEQTLGEFSS